MIGSTIFERGSSSEDFPLTHNILGTVCLLPVRADTTWWHDIVLPHAAEVRYIRGRLQFGGMQNSAPFASAVVVFRPATPPAEPRVVEPGSSQALCS